MDDEASSRQSESAGSRIGGERLASAASAPILQSDENRLFILYLSTQFTPRLSIAHPHHLPGHTVFEHFDAKPASEDGEKEDGFHLCERLADAQPRTAAERQECYGHLARWATGRAWPA
jgi:hypothetical protein